MAVKKSYKLSCLLFCFLSLLLLLLLSACKKRNQLVESEENLPPLEEEKENYDFYSPFEDDASWVDSLLAQIEEERIAEELAKMEESFSEYQQQVPDPEAAAEAQSENNNEAENKSESESETEEKNPVELFFEEVRQGMALKDKNDQLRYFEFDNEILSPQKTEDGFIIVHSNNQNVVRNFYNKEYQLLKKEEWNIKSASDARRLRTEDFVYSEENGSLIQKDITTEAAYETIDYKDSYPVTSRKYAIIEENNYLVQERNWSYDSEKQLLKDEQKDYFYKDNDYAAKAQVFTRKYEYNYSAAANEKEKNEIPPDLKYYENNVLKMQYNYTSQKGCWYCWVYFDENLSVRSYYENDIKIRDEYYNKGTLYRTKLYEKEVVQKEEEQTVIRQGE